LDMKIVVRTFFKVLSRSDVSSERDNTSAKEFTGSPKPN